MGGAEWVKVSVLPTVQNIVARTSNRILVGTPLCARYFLNLVTAYHNVLQARIATTNSLSWTLG